MRAGGQKGDKGFVLNPVFPQGGPGTPGWPRGKKFSEVNKKIVGRQRPPEAAGGRQKPFSSLPSLKKLEILRVKSPKKSA